MAEDETKRNSADLAHGIPLDQLPDGGMLVGHVNGEDVLLVRSGDEIFAVSPHCTHYNGPLAEGLVVGDLRRHPAVTSHVCGGAHVGKQMGDLALLRGELDRQADTLLRDGHRREHTVLRDLEDRVAPGLVLVGLGQGEGEFAQALGQVLEVGHPPTLST